jgi:tRNA A22 N-methylase
MNWDQLAIADIRSRLGPRLASLYDLVPVTGSSLRVADIGCDHGLLPIALIAGGRCRIAIGVDRSEAPLADGRRNAEAFLTWWRSKGGKEGDSGLELRLGDGLRALGAGEVDVVCMGGLGTSAMMNVLQEGSPEVLGGVHSLVMQPYDSRPAYLAQLREWLRMEMGFAVEEEVIIEQGSRFFVTIRAARVGPLAAESSKIGGLGTHLRARSVQDPATRSVYTRYLQHHVMWLGELVASRKARVLTDRVDREGELCERLVHEAREELDFLRGLNASEAPVDASGQRKHRD